MNQNVPSANTKTIVIKVKKNFFKVLRFKVVNKNMFLQDKLQDKLQV